MRLFYPTHDDLTNYKVVKRHQFAMNQNEGRRLAGVSLGEYGVSNESSYTVFHGPKQQGNNAQGHPVMVSLSPAYFVFDIEGANPDYFHDGKCIKGFQI